MRIYMVDDNGNEKGFTFMMKNIESDDVWLAVKKTVEDKIDEDISMNPERMLELAKSANRKLDKLVKDMEKS